MIRALRDIPTLPQVTVELVQHGFREEPDIQKLASIIQKDATLTAKLFKTVNSAAFGLRVEVKSVPQAISLLGLDTLKATIISIAVGEYFINNSFGKVLNPKDFCVHSLATAVIMSEAAKAMKIKESEQLFLIGLMHDMGMLALDSISKSNYSKVLDQVEAGTPLREAEQRVFKCDNLQMWEQLARGWEFPSSIIDLYKGYVRGEEVSISTQRFAESASRLAESLGYYCIKPAPRGLTVPFDSFAIRDEETMVRISQVVKTQVNALAEILDLPAPDGTQVLELLWRMIHQLQDANSKYEQAHNELENRVEVLEELAKVFSGIIKSLNNDSLVFSVLEALIEGFHIDGAFLLNSMASGSLKGFAARRDQHGDAHVEQKDLDKDQIPPTMAKCISGKIPVKVQDAVVDDMLKSCLGDVYLVWLAPIHVRGRFTSIMGLGIKKEDLNKFNTDDFGKIFNIISGEVGLSIENSRLYNRMKHEARTDPLTHMNNRRTIMKILISEFARFKRKPSTLSVAIFDMDHFKAINDNRGHLVGDEFLSQCAQILKSGIRESDYIGRYGGDEFIAVFPDTTPEEARVIVERIRDRLLKFCNDFVDEDIGKKLSVSAGVAGADESMVNADELINLADHALYKAKDLGRDLCVVYEDMSMAGIP